MSFVKTLMVLLVVFFSATGTLHMRAVYRRVVRELNITRRPTWSWFDALWLFSFAIIPGVLRLFIPERVERYTIIFVVVSFVTDGGVTKEQAEHYLHTKGIEAEL